MRTSVYVIAAENGPVKIGIAQNPFKRLKELQTGAAVPLRVAYAQEANSPSAAKEIERLAHEAAAGASLRGEWFDLSVEAASRTIRTAARCVPPAKPNAASIRSEKHPTGCSSSGYPITGASKEPEHPATLAGEVLPDSPEATNVVMTKWQTPPLVPQHLPVSGAQVRAARAFLSWSAKNLSVASTEPTAVIEAVEASSNLNEFAAGSLLNIAIALRSRGVSLTADGGIRWHSGRTWKEAYDLSPEVCRAARALLRLNRDELAALSGLKETTIHFFEGKRENSRLRRHNAQAVVEAFEKYGINFITPPSGRWGGGELRPQGL